MALKKKKFVIFIILSVIHMRTSSSQPCSIIFFSSIHAWQLGNKEGNNILTPWLPKGDIKKQRWSTINSCIYILQMYHFQENWHSF